MLLYETPYHCVKLPISILRLGRFYLLQCSCTVTFGWACICSTGVRLGCRPGHELPRVRYFAVFLSLSWQASMQCLQICNYWFLPAEAGSTDASTRTEKRKQGLQMPLHLQKSGIRDYICLYTYRKAEAGPTDASTLTEKRKQGLQMLLHVQKSGSRAYRCLYTYRKAEAGPTDASTRTEKRKQGLQMPLFWLTSIHSRPLDQCCPLHAKMELAARAKSLQVLAP
jgi:hypothetical protein